MKKEQGHLVCTGLLLTLALLAYSGCSGGGSSGSTEFPPASTSTIRVTTSGLLGTGLVLQNNGTDDLVIDTNKTVNFSTPVEEGSTCNVTILSHPTFPEQFCEVVNGFSIVDEGDITEVQVRCLTTFLETFDNGELNSGYWNLTGQYDRGLVNGQLQYSLMASGGYASEYLPFVDKGCGKISADVTITDTAFTGTGAKDFRTRLLNCGYHTTTDGETPGSRTGDVNAEIILRGDQASFRVTRCLSDDCSNNSGSVEYLTAGDSEGELLGTAPLNSTATLLIDWNNTLTPGQFSFQLNNDPPQNFDPVTAGAAIDAAVPNKPEKYLGVQIALWNPNDKAEMTATIDNVIDGLLSDNFDSGKYLDGSFWEKTDGRLQIENGRLVLETGQEFVDDPGADNRFNKTALSSHDDLVLNADVFEADIALAPEIIVVDNGGNPTEVYALLEMKFRPPNNTAKNDYTNMFTIRAALKEGPPGVGVTAEISAEGCADFSCTAKHTIANDNLIFTTPVVRGQPYHLKIEHLGNGAIDITLDNQETLSVDLSTITEFASTELSALGLRTASRGTDIPGEEAFIRAFFDNVQAGSP